MGGTHAPAKGTGMDEWVKGSNGGMQQQVAGGQHRTEQNRTEASVNRKRERGSTRAGQQDRSITPNKDDDSNGTVDTTAGPLTTIP